MAEQIDLEDGEMQELAMLVVQALQKGETPEEVIEQLVTNGVDRETAQNLVAVIELRLYEAAQAEAGNYQPSGGGGEGMGWLVWIGLIIGINVLSQIFGWGFVIY